MEHTVAAAAQAAAATRLQHWYRRLPSCHRCRSKFYYVAGSQYRCSDCHFDRFCDDRRGSFDLPEEEEEDSLGYPPWDLNARGHKLYNCGIKNRLLEETLKQAREKGIPFSTAKEIAAIALRYAVTARFDVRGYGVEEATRIALAVGRDTIKFGLGLSYTSTSNDTTSTSVGGAGGEY